MILIISLYPTNLIEIKKKYCFETLKGPKIF